MPGLTERPVPRWAARTAHLIAVLTIPSGLWRLGLALGSTMGVVDHEGRPVHLAGNELPHVIILTVLSELAALTAFVLVRPYGEQVPRWIPRFGGRPVAPYLVIVPATLGGLALIGVWSFAFRDVFGPGILQFSGNGWAALMIACYAPLNLWGPLLLLLSWHYWRRRRSRATAETLGTGARSH
jgi:hypothetical protein